jgi:hypothetical protein
MSVMHAQCSKQVAEQIDPKGHGIRAIVMGKEALVTANTWAPSAVTAREFRDAEHFVRAEFFLEGLTNLALVGSRNATLEEQALLDRLEWIPGEPTEG